MIEKYLIEKGTSYKINSSDNAIFPCPKCGDKTSFGISLKTGAYQCFRKNKCGIHGSFKDFKVLMGDNIYDIPKEYKTPPERKSDKLDKSLEYLESRGIPPDKAKHFRIGYLKGSVMFQYHKSGKLVNIKYRKIDEKKFYQEEGCIHTLWSQDLIIGGTLIITEGEIDAMSLYVYGEQAVSIPSGVNNLNWIENDWEFLERFNQIYLCLDDDKAGHEATEKIAKRLGYWRCYWVKLPYKDANECLMQGVKKEKMVEAFQNADGFKLSELKTVKDFTDEVIDYKNNPKELDGVETSKSGLTKILRGWRKAELSVWTGKNSSGKSTILNQEMLHLVAKGLKICIGSFEMQPKKYLWWLLRQKSLGNWLSDEDVGKHLNELAGNLYIVDFFGDIEPDKLFEVMEYGWRKYGIEVFLIDSLMKINLPSDNRKYYGEQKLFVSRLKDFAEQSGSHIHLVAHPRKTMSDGDVVGSIDIAGSGDITNLADNVFVLYRYSEEQKETRISKGKEIADSKLIVKKNREHGEVGFINLSFDADSKTFKEPNNEDVFL